MKTKRKLIAVIAAFAFVVSVLSPVKVFAERNYTLVISFTGEVPTGCSVKYSLDNGGTWSSDLAVDTTVNNVSAEKIKLQFTIANGYKLSGGEVLVSGTQDNGFNPNNIANNGVYDITVADNTNTQVDVQNLQFAEDVTETALQVQYDNTGNGVIQYSTDSTNGTDGTWTAINASQDLNVQGDTLYIQAVPDDGYQIVNHSAIRSNAAGAPSPVSQGTAMETAVDVSAYVGSTIIVEHVGFTNAGGGDPGSGAGFTGSVYFVWVDGSTFYSHKITGLDGAIDNAGQLEYPLNRRPLSSIKDDATNTAYTLGMNYEFCWEESFETVSATPAFASATDKLEYLHENECTIDPTGAVSGENSISTNGDRVFRLTIYNDADDSYEGLIVSVPDEYAYFPDWWDPAFHQDTYDISGTTKADPFEVEAFVLEPTVSIHSDGIADDITSVRALDVPAKAVSITDAGRGRFDLQFHSHFYDNVVFELTDEAGETYYIQINRISMRVNRIAGPGVTTPYYAVDLYYADSSSYTNYDVITTIEYKDGTIETVTLTPLGAGEAQAPNGDLRDGRNWDGGENMLGSSYKIPFSQDMTQVSGFAVNAVASGAFSGTTYGGTYAGSGKGLTLEQVPGVPGVFEEVY